MSDTENTGPTEQYIESGSAHPEAGSKQFEAITSQEELDRIIGQRVSREKAKFADYEEVKAKAAKLDEAEAAKKSEIQKVIERAEAAEKRAEAAELGSLRSEVARTKGVPMGSLTGRTKEEMEASADELISWRDGEQAAKHKQSRSLNNLKSGAAPATDGPLSGKEKAAAALRNMRGGS